MSDSKQQVAFAKKYVAGLIDAMNALPWDDLADAMTMLEDAWEDGRRVFIAGNGGSAATASHMAIDFLKGTETSGRAGLKAIALADNLSVLTALANDCGYDRCFAEHLAVLGDPGDLLIVISGSGNSPNIIELLDVAKRKELKTLALLGMGGGKAVDMVDVSIVVPSDEYGPVEDIHMMLDHLFTAYLKRRGER